MRTLRHERLCPKAGGRNKKGSSASQKEGNLKGVLIQKILSDEERDDLGEGGGGVKSDVASTQTTAKRRDSLRKER